MYYVMAEEDADDADLSSLDNWRLLRKADDREYAAEYYVKVYCNEEGELTDDGDGIVILVTNSAMEITRHRVWAWLSIDYRSEKL